MRLVQVLSYLFHENKKKRTMIVHNIIKRDNDVNVLLRIYNSSNMRFQRELTVNHNDIFRPG
jgi:hypothetical protein